METDRDNSHPGRNTGIPLPFTTAAIGLLLSYVLPWHNHPVWAVLIGFAVGVCLLYIAGQAAASRNRSNALLAALSREERLLRLVADLRPGLHDTKQLHT